MLNTTRSGPRLLHRDYGGHRSSSFCCSGRTPAGGRTRQSLTSPKSNTPSWRCPDQIRRPSIIGGEPVGLHAVPVTGTAVVSMGPERERSVRRRPSFCLFKLTTCFQDPSTRRRPFSTGTAVKNAAKEPTERDSMPVAGPRRTGATVTACSPMNRQLLIIVLLSSRVPVSCSAAAMKLHELLVLEFSSHILF
ncbi:hypothetical protein B0H14DRAFT_2612196 [Mycena olivaceomarginata]|nr:hypothetical protein B0H14DRAFT_2612196 [Mycena olivaceomarginata]